PRDHRPVADGHLSGACERAADDAAELLPPGRRRAGRRHRVAADLADLSPPRRHRVPAGAGRRGVTQLDRALASGAPTHIYVKGAREHTLKDIDVRIPRDRLVVITGLSGSGKSSLAFDTIYAEGQRRYVESLSAYARQFLGQMEKPDVELIEGLSPAVSIDQKGSTRNPRSTVGTVTEIYDHMRL